MDRKSQRGYIETGSVFGWIIFIAVAGFLFYNGKILYDSYSNGYAIGHKDGYEFQHSPEGTAHGKRFRDFEDTFIRDHRGKYKEHTFNDKAFIYGWDAGFHDIVDKMLNS